MKITILITALAIAIAAPAFASPATTRLAIEQFNQSADSVSEIIELPLQTMGVTVSTDSSNALATAMEVVGDDALGHVTVYPGEPSFASDVFDRLGSDVFDRLGSE